MTTATQPQLMIQNSHIVTVMLPRAIPKVLDYLWVDDSVPEKGMFARVDVAGSSCHGLVVAVRQEGQPSAKLKPARRLQKVIFNDNITDFYQWVVKYNLALPGDGLRAGLIKGEIPEQPAPELELVWQNVFPTRQTASRDAVLVCLKDQPVWPSVAALATAAGVTDGVVRVLIKQHILIWRPVRTKGSEVESLAHPKQTELSAPQQQAANQMVQALGCFAPFFLDGVMGSGKTEVYFAFIEQLLAREPQAQVLVLVPEIALTPQLVARFEKRFGLTPTVWHAGIQGKARARAWWQVLNGEKQVIIGARSALFLPFKNLQAIIVDEEHDGSYKQEEVFRYHGRDMAVALARQWQCPVVLCSATPAVETWHNTAQGRYTHLRLPGRYGGAQLPQIHLIDLKQDKPTAPDHYLCEKALKSIAKRLEKGEQSLVFLNRRGMAPLMICRSCGHRVDCPSCDATLVVHHNHLICHHCGFHEPIPTECPKCHNESLHAFGPGTRKLKAQLEQAFPEARVAVADSDLITTDKQMGTLVENMVAGNIDILVGTQMVAKGHHFPDLTLVVVVDGDMGLARGELRAAERTFQLLMQVAGRAGRDGKKGDVLIQTHDPQNQLFQDIQHYDRDGFLQTELQHRKTWGDPPFGKQVALILSGADEGTTRYAAQLLAKSFPENKELTLLGPAPAPLARLRDKYRYRLLLKSHGGHHHKVVQNWLATTKIPAAVRVMVDVDPQSFY